MADDIVNITPDQLDIETVMAFDAGTVAETDTVAEPDTVAELDQTEVDPPGGELIVSEEFLAELSALFATLVNIEPIGQELQDLRGTLPEIPEPPPFPDLSAILGTTDSGFVESPAMPDLIPT